MTAKSATKDNFELYRQVLKFKKERDELIIEVKKLKKQLLILRNSKLFENSDSNSNDESFDNEIKEISCLRKKKSRVQKGFSDSSSE
jgi:hypothetical protein